MRIIRLTEKQLKEAYSDGEFEYISNDTTPQYGGNTYITTAGKMNDEEFGDPLYTDELDVMAPQGYWYGWHYRNTPIHENTKLDNDTGEEYSNPQLTDMDSNVEQTDVFQDNDPTNVNTAIPQTVVQRMKLFLDAVLKLPANKQSMISKELMKQMKLKTDPSWVASQRRTASDNGKRIITNKK